MVRYLVLAGLAAFIQISGAHGCTVGGKCLTPPENSGFVEVTAGEVVPKGQGQILLNAEYYGLPPTGGDFWYFRVGDQVFRVKSDTLEVLEDVTAQMNRAF